MNCMDAAATKQSTLSTTLGKQRRAALSSIYYPLSSPHTVAIHHTALTAQRTLRQFQGLRSSRCLELFGLPFHVQLELLDQIDSALHLPTSLFVLAELRMNLAVFGLRLREDTCHQSKAATGQWTI